MSETLPFEKVAIMGYLDNIIRHWRIIRGEPGNELHAIAVYYIDAYQSVRTSLFGETLPAEETPTGVQNQPLAVPFLSQWGPGADRSPRDCGPACVAMVAQYFGRETTVDETAVLCGQDPGKYTNFQQMYTGLREHGIPYHFERLTPEIIEESLRNGRPVIALVHYGALPGRRVYPPSKPFTGAHFIVITANIEDNYNYHDPYYPPNKGANIPVKRTYLLEALERIVEDKMAYPNQGIVCGE